MSLTPDSSYFHPVSRAAVMQGSITYANLLWEFPLLADQS